MGFWFRKVLDGNVTSLLFISLLEKRWQKELLRYAQEDLNASSMAFSNCVKDTEKSANISRVCIPANQQNDVG